MTDLPFLPPGSASIEDFERLDLRIGRIIDAAPLERAHVPAYRLRLDFGPAGVRTSSARITDRYPDPAALLGRLVVAVVDLPGRRVAGFDSQVLVLGAIDERGRVCLLSVDEGGQPGQRVA